MQIASEEIESNSGQ